MKSIKKKLIVGITGASGAIYGIRLLEVLKTLTGIETHLIISKSAMITISYETSYSLSMLKNLASYYHNNKDIGAKLASGSFKTDGMIISPCSMKTLSSIAYSIESNLIIRAANVCLKEKRKLILLCREFPLHSGYIENMLTLSNRGAIIAPPVPAFYNKPQTIDDIINHTIARSLDLLDIESNILTRWEGINRNLQNLQTT